MKNVESNLLFINHDLRNLIGAAISNLQLLTFDAPDFIKNKNLTASVECLNQAIQLSEDMSTNYKDNVIHEKHNPKYNMVIIPIIEHLNNITKPAYKKLNKMYPIEIIDSYILNKEEKFIEVNQTTLARVRENIINNAINAGATKLDIVFEMKEYGIVIIFQDNGNGMTQEELDKLFLKQHGDGIIHGLGSKSIFKTAEEHGIFVSYVSEKGKGTTIRAVCPYAKA